MNTTKLIFALLAIFFAGTQTDGYAQTLPDKKTTQEYIKKICDATETLEYTSSDGIVYKIVYGLSFHSDGKVNAKYYNIGLCSYDLSRIEFGMYAVNSEKCSYAYSQFDIDWSKMQDIQDASDIASYSSIKLLYIRFVPNSIKRIGFTNRYCTKYGFDWNGKQELVSYIYFPYRNEEGLRERLIKALNHLHELSKADDPFGN
jgi:hypothetical protein